MADKKQEYLLSRDRFRVKIHVLCMISFGHTYATLLDTSFIRTKGDYELSYFFVIPNLTWNETKSWSFLPLSFLKILLCLTFHFRLLLNPFLTLYMSWKFISVLSAFLLNYCELLSSHMIFQMVPIHGDVLGVIRLILPSLGSVNGAQYCEKCWRVIIRRFTKATEGLACNKKLILGIKYFRLKKNSSCFVPHQRLVWSYLLSIPTFMCVENEPINFSNGWVVYWEYGWQVENQVIMEVGSTAAMILWFDHGWNLPGCVSIFVNYLINGLVAT